MLAIYKILKRSFLFVLLFSHLFPVVSKGIERINMIPIQGFCCVSEPLFWKKPPLAVFLRACTFSTFSDLGAEACVYSVVTFFPQLSDPEMIQN